MSEWISVKDGLPERWQSVLVCDASDKTEDWEEYVAYAVFAPCSKGCCDPNFDIKSNNWFQNITHWMPLPSPPKGEVK